MNIHLIGVPLDLGAGKRGTSLGPAAIRYAGMNLTPRLDEQLSKLGHPLIDEGNIPVLAFTFPPEDVGDARLRYLKPITYTCRQLAAMVARHCGPEDLPLVIGGDHSIA
ncbi:MAG TPA: arginase family protein, partial [Ktedonobacteraceae bacterium]